MLPLFPASPTAVGFVGQRARGHESNRRRRRRLVRKKGKLTSLTPAVDGEDGDAMMSVFLLLLFSSPS